MGPLNLMAFSQPTWGRFFDVLQGELLRNRFAVLAVLIVAVGFFFAEHWFERFKSPARKSSEVNITTASGKDIGVSLNPSEPLTDEKLKEIIAAANRIRK